MNSQASYWSKELLDMMNKGGLYSFNISIFLLLFFHLSYCLSLFRISVFFCFFLGLSRVGRRLALALYVEHLPPYVGHLPIYVGDGFSLVGSICF
jgi:hypothetical protein